MAERIQKILSRQGYCSRRAAEKLIEEKRVKVNGRVVIIGDTADVSKDRLLVDNKPVFIKHEPKKLYYMLHKPRGYVTTLSDPHATKSITSLIEDIDTRLFPVGRLDKDSEGMLLLTNDGDFSNLISHPSSGITKIYRVSVKPAVDEEQLDKLISGFELLGEVVVPASVRITGEEKERSVLEITLSEGKNREIRRMCEAVGLEVTRLKRTAIGPVKLSSLAVGKYRELTESELKALKNAAGKNK